MRKAAALISVVTTFLVFGYSRSTTAQSGCLNGPGSAPTDVRDVLTVAKTGKFVSSAQPDSKGGDHLIDKRVRETDDASYDGKDVYNNATPPGCANIEPGLQPNIPRIAGPESTTVLSVGVSSAAELRFVLLSDEPTNGTSTLISLTLNFYRNADGLANFQPFYSTDLIAGNCALSKGYYVFSLTQSQISSLDGAISDANQSSPFCGTYIYVGASITVERDETIVGGEILYAGNTSGVQCQFSISPSASQTFDAGGGAGNVNVSYPNNTFCLWTASSPVNWITIDAGQSGNREVAVKYTVQPNTTAGPRTTTLAVAGQALTITQSCMTVSPAGKVFGPNGGSDSISYSSQQPACALSVSTNVNWIIPGSTVGGMINYTVLANNTASSRQGTITISGYDFIVRQAGAGGDCSGPIPLSPGVPQPGTLSGGDCTSLLSSSVADRYSIAGTAGQQFSLSITRAPQSFVPVFNLIGPDGRVILMNSPSTTFGLPTGGTYIIELTTFSNSNLGSYTLNLCRFGYTPADSVLNYGSGPTDVQDHITVNTQVGCSFGTFSNGWIPIQSVINNVVTFVVQHNDSSSPRIGALNLAGRTIFVRQAGIPDPDFDVFCIPNTLRIVPGSRSDSICTLTNMISYDTPVTLSCSGLPSGATFVFSQNPVTVPGNSSTETVLTVNIASSVPLGTYSFSVKGASGGVNRQFDMTLQVVANSRRAPFDFDGDNKSDLSVWRPSEGNWYIINSSTGGGTVRQYGVSTDLLVPADYDGDGKTDIAVWRPSDGGWYIISSSTGRGGVRFWGVNGDIPVPGDYDGDGKADLAVWRPSERNWYIINSSTGAGRVQTYGMASDKPVPGDYDGDGQTDIAIWRPSDGGWYIISSSTGRGGVLSWGVSGDRPVPGDYDGDGKTDLAIWRPSEGRWYIINSSTGGGTVRQYGLGTDVLVPADYDGDGKTDIAVWRPSDGGWYVISSRTGNGGLQIWGVNTDKPTPSAFIR